MEQLSLFNYDTSCMDATYDRKMQKRAVPKWMQYERCENCSRWSRSDEQPPDGWGIKGFCANHCQRTDAIGYCQEYDDKRRVKC